MNDVLVAIDHVIDLGLASPSKIAVLGGSHGGFLTTHLIGQVCSLQKAELYLHLSEHTHSKTIVMCKLCLAVIMHFKSWIPQLVVLYGWFNF